MPLFDAFKNLAGEKFSDFIGSEKIQDAAANAPEEVQNLTDSLQPEELANQTEQIKDQLDPTQLTDQASDHFNQVVDQVGDQLSGASELLDSVKNFFGK
ncbi:hypothetical protein [Listeria ilorinensis]|uniref:hypothetical protein n=1 Tax=Listeria ilorinensis TaxID=2867439 RepID=UPI001EF53A19|nr:hypothetical protein [Listeria ilorinensis]